MLDKPDIIKGGLHKDSRGQIGFVNDFSLKDVKRFYTIRNSSTDVFRAWQGHKSEKKWFFVCSGAFYIYAVFVDDWVNPSKTIEPIRFELSFETPAVLSIPGGYANGFRALKENAQLIIFSNSSVEESNRDTYRFDQDYWKVNGKLKNSGNCEVEVGEI